MSRSYNGFSPAERAEGGRLQTQAFRAGTIPRPMVCAGCGLTDGKRPVIAHLEDYSKPLSAIMPTCTYCHNALHVRFTNPDRWRMYLASIAGRLGTGGILHDIATGRYLTIGETLPRPLVYDLTLPTGPYPGPPVPTDQGTLL